MEKSIASVFNSSLKKYDIQRAALIPLFNIFYGTAAEVVYLPEKNGKVLDLGAGTGLLTEWVMKKYPKATYNLVDIAEEMLDVGRKRFEKNERVNFIVQDYREGISGGKYDSIISSMSIHHLTKKEKEKLYIDVYNSLKEGGTFVNADQVLGEDEISEEIIKGFQLNYIENSGISREEKDKTYDRIRLDKMDKMSVQMDMLKKAGFKSVDIYFKYYNYIVFRAEK